MHSFPREETRWIDLYVVRMDDLLHSIVGLSGSAADLNQLQTILKQADNMLHANAGILGAVVQNLDPVQHSLGLMYILNAQGRTLLGQQRDPSFTDNVARFLRVCSASQIKLAPEVFCHLCRTFKDNLVASGNPRAGVLPLRDALRKVQPSKEHLSPVHADFMQLCLLSKCYNAATSVLDDDVYNVDPHETFLTPTDFYLYCYYGGMVCIGRKSYCKALDLFLQGLTAPAVLVNAITVATYKKYVLVSLLHAGQLSPLPKFTAARVKQVVEQECRAYHELATAFTSHNVQKLHSSVEQLQPTFTTDNNMGLVKQVVQCFVKNNIQRLTQTFLTLSLQDIATNTGLPNAQQAELYILRMIEAGEIHAQISEKDGMVHFLEDPEQFSNAAIATRIDQHIQQCKKLADKMQTVHDMVSCDRQYLNKITAKERARYDPAEDFSGPSGLFQA